jgi:hypothetical protein
MSLTTPESIQKLQTALHAKAKESSDYRFYSLYDKGIGRTFWRSPSTAAKPMTAQPESTIRS